MISDSDKLKIHQALHDKSVKEVEINGVRFPIEVHTNGCRCVTIEHINPIKWPLSFDEQARKTKTPTKNCFMQQNPNKGTEGALLARKGEALTWDINNWELIMDGKVYKENAHQAIKEKVKTYIK